MGASELPLDALRRRYAEPWRHYHTQRHIDALLAGLQAEAALAREPDELVAAIWYHDAIYDPRAADNEARSAALAEAELAQAGYDPAFARRVADLVMATRGHEPAPGDADMALLLDLDLAILATAPTVYDRYAAEVRDEYAHVPDEAFRAGRAAVLEGFLRRPRLFHTEPLHERWDAAARANLAREIARLRTGG